MPITNSGGYAGRTRAFGARRTAQDWSPGATVRVGFLSLRIIGFRPTPGDGLPDVYELESLDGSRQYDFTPHLGLERVR